MLLNLHSYYSLRYGTLSPRDLIEGMMQGGYDTAVLTDINNSTGSLECIRMGRRARSEEHTSELQSLMRISYAVFCLKKKTSNNFKHHDVHTPLKTRHIH